MRFVSKIIILLFIFASVQTAKADWVKQKVNTFAWLHTIHFVDANEGWIGGSRGTFLKTEDGGETWKQAKKFTDDTIREIFFLNKETGWILCHRDVYNLGTRSPSYLMKTKDGGQKWERIEFSNAYRQRITKMFFAKSGFGLAIGETGALFALTDNNMTWGKLGSPSLYMMMDGAFTDNLHGTIVGGGGTILFTEDAGQSWNQAYISGNAEAKLNAVFYIDNRVGWTVGSQGKVYQTTNAGKYWRSQKTTTDSNLNDVFFTSKNKGWAIGDNGTILQTNSGGNVWKAIDSKSSHKLEKLVFNGEKGWIVGFGGTILSYEKGKNSDLRRPRFRSN